ncbi:MAG TPA: FeoB-associated Cys-rich membrane protein [Bacteroidales bacterium]|jgi:hypothetical protein|nr:FeoB-associated Cys-rich membrane protein [Bacteroidales bacterium]
MSLQEILTYLIVATAAAYSLFSFYRIMKPAGKKGISSCGGQCSGCDAVSFRDELKALNRKS